MYGFQSVPKSLMLSDLEHIISCDMTAYGANCIIFTEARPILLTTKLAQGV